MRTFDGKYISAMSLGRETALGDIARAFPIIRGSSSTMRAMSRATGDGEGGGEGGEERHRDRS